MPFLIFSFLILGNTKQQKQIRRLGSDLDLLVRIVKKIRYGSTSCLTEAIMHRIRVLDNKGLALTYLGNYTDAIKHSKKYFDKAFSHRS